LVLRVGQALGLVLEPVPVLELEPVLEPEMGLVRHSQQQSARSSESSPLPRLISFSFLPVYLLKYWNRMT
jgi:hypothetical protein